MENIKPPSEKEVIHRLHERPKKYLEEWLDFPAHIHHASYRMANPPVERPQSRMEFLQWLQGLRIPETHTVVSEKFGYGVRVEDNGDRLVAVWEAHTEYYSHQVWHIPDDKTLLPEFGPLTFPQYQFPIQPLGTRVIALDIVISPERTVSPVLIRDLLPGPHVYGSRVFGEEISIVTSFTPDDRLHGRYLIFSDSPKALLRHLAKVIDGVATIENYYHLLLLPFPEFTKAVDRIHQMEQHHLEQRSRITENLGASESRTLQEWLSRLMIDFIEVSRFAESMRYRLSASVPYNAILEATLRGFQERPLTPFLPMSDYVLGGISGVAAGYQQLMVRIGAIESDFQSIISVIRTQVNLIQQEQNLVLEDQNLRLLASVDKTTKSQAMLQHTVEGLSVIVIAYYLSGLAGHLFKAFEKWGWINDAATASGLFVPVSLVFSLTLMLLGRRMIRKRMSSKDDEKTL
ncbi:MAG: DUF3422 family protein [Nitrospirae bacterium]|nr:DUF3422 family protein [Nitrospirota bacterium]